LLTGLYLKFVDEFFDKFLQAVSFKTEIIAYVRFWTLPRIRYRENIKLVYVLSWENQGREIPV